MQIQHVKVSTRLYTGFGILLLFCFMIAAFGAFGLQRSNAALHHLADINVTKIELLNQMNESIHIESRVMRTVALLHDDQEAERQSLKITDARKHYDEANAALKQMPLDDAGKAFIQKIADGASAATAINNQFMSMTKTDRDAAVALLIKQGIPANAQWQATLHEFTELQKSKNHGDEIAAESAYQFALWSMFGLGVVAIVVGAFVGATIARSIARQLGGEPAYTVSIANEIAQGNLAVHIDSQSGDETSLLHSVEVMRNNLSEIVSRVRHSSESIGVGIREISSGNADLSTRTDSQASTLEETSASVQQLTATVRQSADNASEASSLARQASDQAEQGGIAVDDVVSTMTSIQDSSRKVVDIISVIDGIAFQTNILALNAAVEAARAGEQGRGFAVVASEVRTLAQHSAKAAKEIKELIDASVKEVEVGTRKVDQAGGVMKKLVQSVRRVNQLIADIATANREQSSGIEQVNEAITQMDETTQQNAALVEQATAAAQAMQSQTQELIRLVGTFQVDERLVEHEPVAHTSSHHSSGKPKELAAHKTPISRPGHLALTRG